MASSVWRFTDDKGVEREISTPDLRAALMKGTLLPSTLVWREGMKEWVPAFTLPDLASAAIAAARVDRQKAGPPSVPPGTPVQKHKPTQTLQGIDPASLGNEAAAALMKIRGVEGAPPAPPAPHEPFGRASAPEGDATLTEAVNRIIAPAPDPLAPRVVKTQPTGSLGTAIAAADIIPRAPKLPTLDAETTGRPKSIPPGPPPRPKSIPPGSAGPARGAKSMPPPLPPRSVRTPLIATGPDAPKGQPPLPRKQTLMGMSPAIAAPAAPITQVQGPRSKPPPPPRRGAHPSVPPGGGIPPAPTTQVQGPPGAPARPPLPTRGAPVEARGTPERPKPPSPPKRSVRPPAPDATPAPPAVLPVQLTPTELASVPNQPTPAATPPSTEERHVGQTTANLGTVNVPSDAGAPKKIVDEPTDPLSNSQILGARELLASIADPEEENTVTLTRSAGDIIKEARTPQPRPAKVPKRVQIAQQQAAAAAAAATPIAAGNDTEQLPAQAAPSPEPSAALENAAIAAAAAEPAAPVRQRTMEMSLADHEDAALSQPIPGSARPAPRVDHSVTEKLPSLVSQTGGDAAAAKPKSDATLAPSATVEPRGGSVRPGPERMSRPDRASFTNEGDDDGEYKIKRRVKPPVEVPRRSIVGASLLWMLGLVIFFFVGRCAGYSRASQFVEAKAGAGQAFKEWSAPEARVAPTSTSAEPEEAKPCWVARQPTKWAPSATKYVPIDMEAIDGSMSFGFGLDETEAAGIVVEPKSGKFEQKFNQKLDPKEKAKIARVVPMPSREGGYFVSKKGERDFMPILGADPFFLVFSKESIGWAASDVADQDSEPTEIFALVGEGDVSSQRVLDEGTAGYFLSFRRGNVVYGGYFDKQKKPLGALTAIPGSSETAEEGKPKSGTNGEETAVVFAERAEKKGPWTVRLGHAKAGTIPTTTEVLTFPDGGPGGDVFAPDVVGLPDGRWLVMWTEGDEKSAIRALTYSKDFQPIGDPIALSPPGDFGQAVLGNAAGYTIVAFFQRNAQGDFELWGAVLRCG